MLGASHECVQGESLSRITVAPERARNLGRALRANGVPCVVLATCHRFEVYWDGACADHRRVLDLITRSGDILADDVNDRRDGEVALRHLMAVASGARSQRPGEPEILGQLRNAWQCARADNTSSPLLDLHVGAAIAAARHVRRRIEVAPPQTIGQATVALLAESLQRGLVRPESAVLRVLLVGAGAVARSTAPAIIATQGSTLPSQLTLHIANRTEANAHRLASTTGASVSPWASWHEQLATADIVICSARTSDTLVTAAHAIQVDRVRREPTLWIDLGSPPNIATDARAPGVHRRTMRDLPGVSCDAAWQSAADRALNDEIHRFRTAMDRRLSEPTPWMAGAGEQQRGRGAFLAKGTKTY